VKIGIQFIIDNLGKEMPFHIVGNVKIETYNLIHYTTLTFYKSSTLNNCPTWTISNNLNFFNIDDIYWSIDKAIEVYRNKHKLL